MGFQPIPLGVFRGERKKRKEKKETMGELCKFVCSLNSMFLQLNNYFHQCTLYIPMSSIHSRATFCSAGNFWLVDRCTASCSSNCEYLKILKRQFCSVHSKQYECTWGSGPLLHMACTSLVRYNWFLSKIM